MRYSKSSSGERPRRISMGWTLRAAASRQMLTRLKFRSPRSTLPTYVRCKPAPSAKSSWDMALDVRSSLIRIPTRVLTFTGRVNRVDDYKSTPDK